MAFQMSLSLTPAVTITDAYHHISHLSGGKNNLNVTFSIFKNQTESATPEYSLDDFSFVMETGDLVHDDGVNDKNYYKQVYEYLKAAARTDVEGNTRDYTSATDLDS